jgi:Ni/Co efflux regulator RcnB
VRRLLTVMLALMVGGSVFASQAEAGDRRHHRSKHSRGVVVYESRHGGYYRPRDVVVIRDYYRPYYRPVAVDVNRYYYRGGYLPPGWHRRIRPVPVYLEPQLVVVPRGYQRGIIDGRAVVYNDRGFLLDVAMLF